MVNAPCYPNTQAFSQELMEKLPDLIDMEPGGVLILFSSHRHLDETYEQLTRICSGHLLKQSQLGKHQLLEQHRKYIDQGQKSIILGLQSFAEGVDLIGNYCNHVIITKLNFKAPNTPIEKTIQHHYQKKGLNAFYQHSLPEASLRLTQAAGRLVRSTTDRGRVTLCDRRIIDQAYGLKLLDNLPGFTLKLPRKEAID